ncbi:MAG: response regulator [Deltaproteobacteria bacterium]|nr:response regulator [Deltaproteobacteria bacterium]
MRVRVLVVEDDEDLREVLGEVLRASNFVVASASTWEAQEIATRCAPEVVLVDTCLGEQYCERLLSRLTSSSDSPPGIVVCSARRSGCNTCQYASVFIPRPFDLDALVSALLQAHRRRGPDLAKARHLPVVVEGHDAQGSDDRHSARAG